MSSFGFVVLVIDTKSHRPSLGCNVGVAVLGRNAFMKVSDATRGKIVTLSNISLQELDGFSSRTLRFRHDYSTAEEKEVERAKVDDGRPSKVADL